MARVIGKLTALDVSRATKPKNDGGGLWLDIDYRTGARSWLFRYGAGGRRYMGLGPVHTLGLADARQLATACRRQLLDGVDPIEARKAERQRAQLEAARSVTFQGCADRYIASHRSGWRNPKHAAQWPSTFATYAYPVFGHLPVQDIDVGLVLKAIEPIWTTKPETANRLRGRIESVIDWATARGYRQGENPARWRGHLDQLLPAKAKVRRVEHHAALPYGEVADFMVELHRQEGVAARALEFAILTAARTGEALGATWGEIDLEARQWVISAARMKGGREHRVPLSDAAIGILIEMMAVRTGEFVFPGGKARRPLSNMAFLMLLRRMGRGDLTGHGFRSTFSDWCAERTNFPSEVREMALAHAVGDKVEAAYRRGNLLAKRQQLMTAWGQFCTTPAPPAGNVVAIAR